MKNRTLGIALVATFSMNFLLPFSSITLPGDATKAILHKKSGTWIVGATAAEDGGPLLFSVGPAAENVAQTLTTYATANQAGEFITHLAVSEQLNNPYNVRAVYVRNDTPETIRSFGANRIETSIVVKDANNDDTPEIIALTAGSEDIFAAVTVEDDDVNTFGIADSGIARIEISNGPDNDLTQEFSTFEIDPTKIFINGDYGTPAILNKAPALYWCQGLQKLYV